MPVSELENQTENIFSPGGILARRLTNYEPRESQRSMALAIAAVLAERSSRVSVLGQKLTVEAGTGTGKTLAYLVPAVLSGRKVVVSTGTLNLQEQILEKEIPFIREHIAPGLTALCLKGRQNYLCLYRWYQLRAPSKLPFFSNEDLKKIETWLKRTTTGDRAELEWLADDSLLWKELSVSTSQCLGSSCPESSRCFINRLRQKAGNSQLLIVNHHLFFSDLALRRSGFAEVLPRYETVIFDEAHRLETIATYYFGVSISLYQIKELVKDINRTLEAGPKDE
ncbi:MAG: ATP-dependent DNA helicase, partial [Thermodesulfobacteriota bacterium]